MKKVLLLLTMFLLTQAAISQVIQQKGVAYRYNGKQKRTPLGNVTISYAGNSRSVISGEENGVFNLVLEGKKMGDRIGVVTVKKREMMVFNQQAVDEWSIRKEPLTLILCNADEFERQKEKLIAIGKDQAKKKYERQKAELEAKLSASQIKQAEYEVALDKAYEDLDRIQKNIGDYADLFARIDESEIDTLAMQAVDAFSQGDVERAIKLFEQGNYVEKLKKAKAVIEQSQVVKSQIERAEAKAKEDSVTAINSIRAQVKAYKVNNDWEKAGPLLKVLADELNTYSDTYNYALYCCDHKMYDEAETYIKRAISIIEIDPEAQSPEDMYKESELIVELARICKRCNMIDESIGKYQWAFRIREWLAGYERHHPSIRAYMVYKQESRDRDKYLPLRELYMIHAFVETGNELASVYYSEKFYNACERVFKSIVSCWEKQTGYFREYGKIDAAKAIVKLADFYFNIKHYQESEDNYKKAIGIIRVDKKNNLKSSKFLLANTLYKQGRALFMGNKYEDAIPPFEEALTDYRELMKTRAIDMKTQRKNVSAKFGNVAFYSIYAKRYAEAEQYAREGLEVDSTQHWIAGNLAAALLFQGNTAEAQSVYVQYKDELKESFLDDFKQFSEAGVIPKEYEADVEKIKKMLNE